MKSSTVVDVEIEDKVAPFTGAWIEIFNEQRYKMNWEVAPFTGAWIEIYA